jgi:hypothetical protein
VAQPTADDALARLEPLVGEWAVEATWPNGDQWPGTASMGWHESGRHLVLRATLDHPEAPDNTSIIGCDGAGGTYSYLYSDERGVCRIFDVTVGDGVWTFERVGEPFAQRFTWTLEDGGDTIAAHLEMAEEGDYHPDFDMVYRRVRA